MNMLIILLLYVSITLEGISNKNQLELAILSVYNLSATVSFYLSKNPYFPAPYIVHGHTTIRWTRYNQHPAVSLA